MQIELAPGLDKRFRAALRKSMNREIGGMLMAEQLAPGKFRIVDFSLDSFSGSHVTFRRDPDVHLRTLRDFFERTGQEFSRFNYLGEWHSHPRFSVSPSYEDIKSMTDIVEDRGTEISFAVLLIVRLRFWVWLEHSMMVFQRQQEPFPIKMA